MKTSTTRIHSDFELEQFLQELQHEVNSLVYSDEDGATKEDKFTEHVMEILAEAGETEGIRLCHYEKENKWENIEFKINGYSIEDGFESLDIFITSYLDNSQINRITKADFDKLIKWPLGFLNAAFKGYLEEIEPSTEAYGLAELARKNVKSIIRINLFVITNYNAPHDPPKNHKMKGFEELTFNFHIWDAERLHRLAQSKNNREPIEIDFEETLNEVIPCLTMPSGNELYECYLAIVPGSLLSALYRNYGTRLLESNVRAFLQQTGTVNKGIRDTIREEPFMFLPYNNGLASTAQEVKTRVSEDGQLVITGVKDFQIVNGGQTTASLYHTEKKYKADISQVFVQMKLTVIKDENKKDETVPYISRFANSQNKVSELDLTSNNPFLQRLELLSRTTFAIDPEDTNKQSIWFFERVKGQYREALNKEPTKSKKEAFKIKYPRHQLVIKSEIAKYINIWKQLPHFVSKGAQKNYNYFIKEVEKEFKKKKPGRIYWQDIVSNAILFKAADKLFGRKNQNPIGDTNIKSYTISYTLSYLHHLTNGRLDFSQIWERQILWEDFHIEIEKGLKFVYLFLDSLDVALISEAAKAEKTWNKLREINEHPFDMEVLNKYTLSEKEFTNRYKENSDDNEEAARYSDLQRITSYGVKFWDGLVLFNLKEDLLSFTQHNYLTLIRKKIKNSGTFTDKEIERGVEIIEKLILLKVDFTMISDLSKLEEKDLIDPSILYNRFSKIDSDTWKKIIALGEQTNTLSFHEIAVIRTVIQKLKKKENIDLRRLTVTEDAIEKVKKYGIKV